MEVPSTQPLSHSATHPLSHSPYAMTKQEADKLRHREEELKECLPTQKQVLVSLVSNRQPKKNEHYNSIISKYITIDYLFDD